MAVACTLPMRSRKSARRETAVECNGALRLGPVSVGQTNGSRLDSRPDMTVPR